MKINKQDIIDMLIKYNPNISYTIIKDVVDNFANNVDLDNIPHDSILAHKGYQFIVRLIDEELKIYDSLRKDILRRYPDVWPKDIYSYIREYNRFHNIVKYTHGETFGHDGWNKISPRVYDIITNKKFLVSMTPENDGYNVCVYIEDGYQYTCGDILEEAKYMALDLLRAYYDTDDIESNQLIYKIGE